MKRLLDRIMTFTQDFDICDFACLTTGVFLTGVFAGSFNSSKPESRRNARLLTLLGIIVSLHPLISRFYEFCKRHSIVVTVNSTDKSASEDKSLYEWTF